MSELRTNRIVPRDGLVSGTGVGGGIIQVRSSKFTGTELVSCISAFADSSIACSITPTRADSKILVSVSVSGEGNATNQARFTHRIKRVISGGSTDYIAGVVAGGRIRTLGVTGDNSADASTSASSFSINNYMDEPATTSTITYTLQFTYDGTTGSGTYYVNRNVSDSDSSGVPRYVSWMTLMEVSG